MKYYLAIDIGASSGRHVVGNQDGQTFEVYRFPNGVKREDGHLVWDVERLFYHVKEGIKRALKQYPLQSLAIDTWGVDYVLQDGRNRCFSYRDGRTQGVTEAVHRIVPFPSLYEKTGIQFQPFNTLYQLYEDKLAGRLQDARGFLMLPEYLNYLLTGVVKKEYTNATTTGLVNVFENTWDFDIIDKLGFPRSMFAPLDLPGTTVGRLLDGVAAEVGGQVNVKLCCSHDTASAVEGIPVGQNQPYLSSGTWSLLGIKSARPHTDQDSRLGNWSNEGGVGYVRYQKNIMGMWLINRLKEELCPQASFDQVTAMAEQSSFGGVAEVDGEAFLAPVSMKSAFDGCFSHINAPQSCGDYFRCALNSLAYSYKRALEQLRRNTGICIDKLYVAGGGANNRLLNSLTQQVCGVQVVAMPFEATAVGNLKIQRGER